jgi:hypothetical protein
MSGERRLMWGLIGERSFMHSATAAILGTAIGLSWAILPWQMSLILIILSPAVLLEFANPDRVSLSRRLWRQWRNPPSIGEP